MAEGHAGHSPDDKDRQKLSRDQMTVLNTNWKHTDDHYTAKFGMLIPGRRNLERALNNLDITANYEPIENLLFVQKTDVPAHLTELFAERKPEIQR